MDIQTALSALAALSQKSRLDAFRLLIKAGNKGLAAGEISNRLGIIQNTMSAHLATLAHAGLVTRERQSQTIRYFADYQQMRALLGFLLEDCCGGNPDLCDPLLDKIACPPTTETASAKAHQNANN